MLKRWQIAAIVGGVTLLLIVGGAVVFAQRPNPVSTHHQPVMGLGWGGRGWSVFDAVAEALGLTPEQLFAELHGGKSLAEVAEGQGVELEEVREAARAARAEAMRQAIQQAVEEGRISQDEADWLLEGLDKGFLPLRKGLGRRCRLIQGDAPLAAPSSPLRLHSF